jgi:hypothetical protein
VPPAFASLLHRLGNMLTAANGWPALCLILAVCVVVRLPPGGGVAPAHGDVPAYLAGAYHLRTAKIYSMATTPGATTPGPATPELGREPVYPLFLAAIMVLDRRFGGFTPACLAANNACPASTYRIPSLANAALILATGIAVFLLGRMIAGRPAGGLIAAAYLLWNAHFNKAWADLMSDRLAVFLVALAMLALACAWQKSAWAHCAENLRSARTARLAQACRFGLAGAGFATLTLTKAIFLPFSIAAWLAAAVITVTGRKNHAGPGRFIALLAAASIYVVLVGGWVFRNWEVSGMARLTDARSGIALSTREVFDTMSPRQYAAALVYWTGSTGPKFAARWFGADTANRFNLDMPGSYYDVGQNGYMRRVHELQAARGLPFWQAAAETDREIIGRIRRHFGGYLVTMLPLTYRGLWIDEFLFLGIPCLSLALWHAIRRRDGLLLALLSIGAFNIIAYAAVSLNLQRYQMTAMPAIALAVGVTFAGRKPKPEQAAIIAGGSLRESVPRMRGNGFFPPGS